MNTLKSIYTIIIFFTTIITFAQNNDVVIKTTKITDHIYMLEGQGGNIGISVGDDGVFMIDSQYAPLTLKILEAIKAISDKQIKFLVNTHHHGDHTGGNANIGILGTTIIAHDNVYKRLNDASADKLSATKESLPIITFNDKLSIYLNGEQVFIFHVDNAHTDGDALLYFTESNILHTGDTFFSGLYPYIDLNSGGTVNGYIDAVKQALILIDEHTKIIPGHGKLSNKKEYQFFLSMLENLKETVSAEIAAGKTEDEVVSNKNITKIYDDLGYSWSFINSEKIRRTFYLSLKK
jgi:cyclase